MTNFLKKLTFTFFTLLSMILGTSMTAKAYSDNDIPTPPNEGVHLNDVFAPAVGNGVSYNKNKNILQMSDGKNQTGAVWGKSKLDLTKPFELECYIYLGNQGDDAADGMTFTMQRYGNSVIGEKGQGLGAYGKYIGKYRYSLEFDQYHNGDGYDSQVSPKGKHVAFVNGQNPYYHGSLYVHDSSWSDGKWLGLKIECKPLGGERVNLKYTITDNVGNLIVSKNRDMNYGIELGTSQPYWGFTSATGNQYEISALSFGKIPQQASIKTKNIKIYKGQSWIPKENFLSATAENGDEITFDDPRISYTDNVNPQQTGEYNVTYTYKGKYQTIESNATVSVLDRLSINANDISINQGAKFNPFDSNIGLKAYDKVDGDLINKIVVTENDVDSSVPGAYHVTYQVTNSSGEVAKKTITVTVKPYNPWPEGTDGWRMFSGENINLQIDSENSIIDSNKVFLADNAASIYKIYTGKDKLKVENKYRVTVFFKPLDTSIPLSQYKVKVSLKSNPASNEYRELINTTLDKGTLYKKGFYSVTTEFSINSDETNPLINIENFQGGYIGSVSVLPIN